jgi:hypothetical protein
MKNFSRYKTKSGEDSVKNCHQDKTLQLILNLNHSVYKISTGYKVAGI